MVIRKKNIIFVNEKSVLLIDAEHCRIEKPAGFQIVTEKTGFWNCNDFLCKSLICRLLSLKCPLVNQLLIFPLQAMCNSCNEGAKLKGL